MLHKEMFQLYDYLIYANECMSDHYDHLLIPANINTLVNNNHTS